MDNYQNKSCTSPHDKDPNESLLRFLDRYCLSDVSPGYAVMLRGPWGSGKTKFINDYQKTLSGQNRKPLYVSLFGVSKPSDISDQFFAQIHPLLGNHKVQKTWTLLKSLIKGTVRLDLDGDNKEDVTLKIAIPELEKWASTTGAVLIFDDLERCEMPVESILGFINQFVEHDGYRVLILANEEGGCLSSNIGFRTIKEKVIGRTFQIQPNIHAALDHFLSEVSSRKAHSLLITAKERILEVFTRAGYLNLRQLRQAIFDFCDFWDCIYSDDLDRKLQFLQQLLNDVLTLSMEYRAGTLTVNDIAELEMTDWSRFARETDENPDIGQFSKKQQVIRQHGLDQNWTLAVPAHTYSTFFEQGNLSASLAKNSLANSNLLADEFTPSWKRLWYLRSLTDEDFKKFSEDVQNKLINLEYVSEGELLHVVSMLLSLAAAGLISKTKEQMLSTAKKVVRRSVTARKLDPGSSSDLPRLDIGNMSAFGLGYTDYETGEFQEFLAYYREKQRLVRNEWIKQRAIEWMPILENDPATWANHLNRSFGEESWFADDPVFAHVSVEKAAKALWIAPTSTLEMVRQALDERYIHPNIYRVWRVQELPFLQNLHAKLKTKLNSKRGKITLSKYYLENRFLPSVEKNIKALTSYKNQIESQSKVIQ